LEAIALANQTRFRLGASVWTKDIDCADRYFDALQAGTVWINTHNVLDLTLPFGGDKESGVGLELGREGVLSHTKLRSGVKAHRQMI
jgi:phenylacetaldehyde dehydrogenase